MSYCGVCQGEHVPGSHSARRVAAADAAAKAMHKNTARDTSGRYDHDTMSLLCTCGHTLGVHAAENRTKTRPCFNEDVGGDGEPCGCENFKKARVR